MQHLVNSDGYSVVPISSSLLTCTLFSTVRTTLIYKDTRTPACKIHIQKCSAYVRPVCAIRKKHHTSRMRMHQLTLLNEKLS
jgi:hypothetical protein